MNIREATVKDLKQLQELYVGTITTVNAKDYTPEQIAEWASTATRTESLINKLTTQYFYVAEENYQITGFASLENSGHLDMMYVHKDFQNKGIATQLLNTIIKKARSLGAATIDTDASKTARPFFEKHGFTLVQQQTVYINNTGLINYKMKRTGISETKPL